MPYASCPTAVVNAPVGVVWALLMDPAGWGKVFDVRIDGVDPPGRTVQGQQIMGESGLQLFHLKVAFLVREVDAEHHRLVMDIKLPLGITVHEDLRCMALDPGHCRVDYHCGFEYPSGWRGALAHILTGHEREVGPIDSLSRLKRAAELRFAAGDNINRQQAARSRS